MPDHDTYERWIERRKRVEVPTGFADDIVQRAPQCAAIASSPALLNVVAASPVASFAVCFSAILIGSLPFVYVAYAARLISF